MIGNAASVTYVVCVVNEDKKTIYTRGRSIDDKTHYGENVLLISLLEQALLRQANYIAS